MLRKRKLMLLIALVVIVASVLCGLIACSGVELTLKFNVDGSVYAEIITNGNEVITMPSNPTKEGYTFDGWFWDEGIWQQPFTANSLLDAPISSDMQVYAKFTLQHKHTYSYFDVLATCETGGYTECTCECGYSYIIEVEPTGHAYFETVVEPTCTEQGFTRYTCFCGDSYVDNYKLPIAHNYLIERVEPNCINNGILIYMCICGDSYQETLPTTHNYTSVVREPTCIEQGYTTYTCDCGDSYTDDYEPILGHDFNSYISDKNSTIYEDGTKTSSCNNKGCSIKDTIVDENSKLLPTSVFLNKRKIELWIGATETIEATITPMLYNDDTIHWSSSNDSIVTVTNNGVISAINQGTATISALSTYGLQSSICEVIVREYKLIYDLKEDYSSYVVSGFEGKVTSLVVPEIYNNLRVSEIAAFAFKDCYDLQSIILPDSIVEIGMSSFENCQKLESISLPTSLTTIQDHAFQNCTMLSDVVLPNSLTYLGSAVFSECTLLATISLSNKIEYIGEYAFNNCSSLKEITLPDSLRTLGQGAFKSAIHLKSIILSSNLSCINNVTFQGCNSLEKIDILANISAIGASAFSDCISLIEIKLLGNLSSIGHSAFYNCESIEKVYYNSSTVVSCTINNYIMYNVGKYSEGVTFVIGKNGYVPNNLLAPTKNESTHPKITAIQIEEGSEFVDYKLSDEPLPYLCSVEIASTVTNINNAFINSCKKSVVTKEGVEYIDDWAIITENVSSISNKDQLTRLLICRDIQVAEYENITNLTYITMESGVTSIGNYAFSGCSNLKSVTILDSVTSIGSYAFYDCATLTSVIIGESVSSIGNCAFRGCSKLTTMLFKDTTSWYYTSEESDWRNQQNGTSIQIRDDESIVNSFTSQFYITRYWYKL